jgi:hypothetical protein
MFALLWEKSRRETEAAELSAPLVPLYQTWKSVIRQHVLRN